MIWQQLKNTPESHREKYEEVFKEYREAYLDITEVYETNKNSNTETNNQTYEITFTPNREVLLDNKYALAKPIFNSGNEAVFSCIYETLIEK